MWRKDYVAVLVCVASVVGIFVLREQQNVWWDEHTSPRYVPVSLLPQGDWRGLVGEWSQLEWEEQRVGCANLHVLMAAYALVLERGVRDGVCVYDWKRIRHDRFWHHVRPIFSVHECPSSFLFWAPSPTLPHFTPPPNASSLFFFFPAAHKLNWTRECA